MKPPDPERCERLIDAIVGAANDGGFTLVELACAVATLRDLLASGQMGSEPAVAICHWDQAAKANGPS
jgi:hypothetical protein